MAPFSFMEIQMTARVTGPFGELDRKKRLTSENYPVAYLKHLVEIGAAYATVEHRVEPTLETKEVVKAKKPLPPPSLSVSRRGQASQKKIARKSGKAD